MILKKHILGSIVVSIPACHAGDPGSIPGRGVFCLISAPTQTALVFLYGYIIWPSGAMDSASDFGSEGCRFESCLGRLFTFVSPILFYNIINSPYKEFVLDNSHNDPSIAQLVERWTVVDSIEIHRSLVQIRFEGIFFKPKITKYFVLYRQLAYLRTEALWRNG